MARSFIGAQAPLGQAPIQGPARLRTETSRNIGSSNLRQQSIGGVSADRASAEGIADNPGDASQEGSGDSQRRRPHNAIIIIIAATPAAAAAVGHYPVAREG